MITNAVVYYRRSTGRQEQSIGDQRKAVEAWAAEHGHELVREYVDDAISGATTEKREAFLQMIEHSASGDFKAILVYDLSRFGRTDSDETGHYRYVLRQNGVEVVYCMDNPGTGDESDLVRGVLQWQKHKFLIDLSRDITRGMISRAEKGYCVGGKAPYGFRRALADAQGNIVRRLAPGEHKASDAYVVTLVEGDPAQVDVVRRIFDMCIAGRGYRAIAMALNDEGVPSARGGRWAASSVRTILTNPAYVGDRCWNRKPKGKFFGVADGKPRRKARTEQRRVRETARDEWVIARDAHPALVDRETFDRAQRRIEPYSDRGGVAGAAAHPPYPLSGLLYCGCGAPMWGDPHVRKNGKGERVTYRYYACSAGMSGKLPDHKLRVPADPLERFVVRTVQDVYGKIDPHAEVKAVLRKERAADAASGRRDVAVLKRRIAQLDKALGTAARRVVMAEDDETAGAILTETAKVRRERAKLTAQVEALSAEPALDCDIRALVERIVANIRDLEQTPPKPARGSC